MRAEGRPEGIDRISLIIDNHDLKKDEGGHHATVIQIQAVAYRQCPKRLWLEIYRPECREDSAATQAIFPLDIASVNSQDVSMTPK